MRPQRERNKSAAAPDFLRHRDPGGGEKTRSLPAEIVDMYLVLADSRSHSAISRLCEQSGSHLLVSVFGEWRLVGLRLSFFPPCHSSVVATTRWMQSSSTIYVLISLFIFSHQNGRGFFYSFDQSPTTAKRCSRFNFLVTLNIESNVIKSAASVF